MTKMENNEDQIFSTPKVTIDLAHFEMLQGIANKVGKKTNATETEAYKIISAVAVKRLMEIDPQLYINLREFIQYNKNFDMSIQTTMTEPEPYNVELYLKKIVR